MIHATYIGPKVGPHLRPGMSALIRPAPRNSALVFAQFDDYDAEANGTLLSCGWHPFSKQAFIENGELNEA